MTCPRCGTKTDNWPCPECGFPVKRYRRKRRNSVYAFPLRGRWHGASFASAVTDEVN